MTRLLTTEELAKTLGMTPGVALKVLAELQVRPFPFGRGRGRGHRWSVVEVEEALHAWRARKDRKAARPSRVHDKTAQDFFAQPYEASAGRRAKQ